MTDEQKEIAAHFKQAVNMTAGQVEKWLGTGEAQSVGQKTSEGAESTGHHSGKLIVDVLHKKPADYTDDDFTQMQLYADAAGQQLCRPAFSAGWRH